MVEAAPSIIGGRWVAVLGLLQASLPSYSILLCCYLCCELDLFLLLLRNGFTSCQVEDRDFTGDLAAGVVWMK